MVLKMNYHICLTLENLGIGIVARALLPQNNCNNMVALPIVLEVVVNFVIFYKILYFSLVNSIPPVILSTFC